MTTRIATCLSCGARWSDGRFSAQCAECGGGAMEAPCLVCGGRCGEKWLRDVSDSNDSHRGHWAGRCGLPPEQQMVSRQERYWRRQSRARRATWYCTQERRQLAAAISK